jgi:hypothetical protein
MCLESLVQVPSQVALSDTEKVERGESGGERGRRERRERVRVRGRGNEERKKGEGRKRTHTHIHIYTHKHTILHFTARLHLSGHNVVFHGQSLVTQLDLPLLWRGISVRNREWIMHIS